jgi:hypothetical protein
MKNQSIVVGLALFILALMPNQLFAQTTTQQINMAVTGSALIRVMKGASDVANVDLTLGGPLEAGLEVKPVSEDRTTRLRISSLAQGTLPADGRKITAVITSGSMTGSRTMLELALEAPEVPANANDFVNFNPDGGVLAPALQNLGDHVGNKAAITLVTDIYTCWSGTAVDDGYIIHYKYSKNVVAGTATPRSVTITFTIAGQ